MDRLFVSISGGKTSGYMSYLIKKEYDSKIPLQFVFANTGQENEETLEFVHECSTNFDLGVTWLEALVDPRHGKGIRHTIVDYETASRNGEPFEAFIAKSGIPNVTYPSCSDRLKALPIESYKKSIGWSGCSHAIGIRDDESRRKAKNPSKYNLVYPLCDWFPSDKSDVNDFWDSQNFSLGLEEHEGNCKTCWKKSDKKLFLLALEHPERFDFMATMESKYRHVKPNSRNGQDRVFFRQHRDATDIMRQAKEFTPEQLREHIGLHPDSGGGCSESCEAYGD